MLATLTLLVFLAQDVSSRLDPPRFPDFSSEDAALRRTFAAHEREIAALAARKDQRFIEKFNRLAAAMEDFSRAYRTSHVIDAKAVKAIKQAYRELESAESWFAPGSERASGGR